MKIDTPAKQLHSSLANDLASGAYDAPIDVGEPVTSEADYDADEVQVVGNFGNAAMRALGLYSQTPRKGVKPRAHDLESSRPDALEPLSQHPPQTKYLTPHARHRFHSAGDKLRELQRRDAEIQKTVDDAQKTHEETRKAAGEQVVTTTPEPRARFVIKDTPSGFKLVDQAGDSVLETYKRRADAEAHLNNLRGVQEPRFQVRETDAGFAVVGADGTIVETYTTKAQADLHIADMQPAKPTVAEFSPAAASDDAARAAPSAAAWPGVDYDGWVSLGDAELDRLMAGRLDTPHLRDGMLGGIRMVGAGGDAKVPDEGHIRAYIGTMAKTIEKKLPAHARTEVSLAQTRAAADIIGLDPEKLATRLRDGFQIDANNPGALAAHVVAAKDLLVSEVKKLDELTDAARGVDATIEAKLAWKQQAVLVANIQKMYKGAQTDIARALSALRTPNRDDAALLGRDYSRLVDDIGGINRLDEEIDSFAAIGPGNPKAKIELVGASSKWDRGFAALHEVWVNAILSGYWTHVKNISGALTALMADDAVLGYTALRQLPRALTGAERDVTFGDVQARVFGQVMSLSEAFTEAGARFKSREEIYGSSKLENAVAGGQRSDAFSAEALGVKKGVAGNLINAVGQVATAGRVPTRLLVAEDTFFKVIAYRGSLYEQAYRAARQRGKQGADAGTFIADFLHNPPEQAIEEARDTAKYITLQQELEGAPKHLQQVMRNRYMRWIVPFYKTPTNALLWMGQHSPVAWMSDRYKGDIAAGGYRAARARSRMQLGSLVWGGLSLKTYLDPEENGSCTGALSNDPRVVDAYRRQGVMPYSCKFGDTWIPYNLFEPVSGMLSLVADVNEVLSHPDTDEKTAEELVMATVLTVGYGLTQKSYLEGINRFMKAISNPYGNAADNVMKSYVKSIVPGSAALNEIRKVNDDIKRFRDGYLDDIMDRLPGLSTRLPAERDLWGRVTSLHRAYSPYNENVVDREITRLRLPLSKHPNGFGDLEFTPEQRDYFHKRAGEMSYERLEKLLLGDSPRAEVYRKLKVSSEKLSTVRLRKQARTSMRKLIRAEIGAARAMAFKEMMRHETFGPELTDTIAKIKQFLETEKRQIEEQIQ